jgi:hypothetical protein
MRSVGIRAKLVMVSVLAASAAYVGFWALIAPHSFYRSFPIPGHHWVSTAGPYDEHLVRDVGGLYLSPLDSGYVSTRATSPARRPR